MQNVAVIVISYLFLSNSHAFSIPQQLLWVGYVVLSAYGIGAVLEAKPFAAGLEIVRQALFPVLAWFSEISEPSLVAVAGVAAVGILATLLLRKADDSAKDNGLVTQYADRAG